MDFLFIKDEKVLGNISSYSITKKEDFVIPEVSIVFRDGKTLKRGIVDIDTNIKGPPEIYLSE